MQMHIYFEKLSLYESFNENSSRDPLTERLK